MRSKKKQTKIIGPASHDIRKKSREARTGKANCMSGESFANLKEALEGALAFERRKPRDLHVTRIRAPVRRRLPHPTIGRHRSLTRMARLWRDGVLRRDQTKQTLTAAGFGKYCFISLRLALLMPSMESVASRQEAVGTRKQMVDTDKDDD